MALVTVQEIRDYLQITSDESDTTAANLGTLANYASFAIESYCGREFASSVVTEIHDGGKTSIFVDRLPINNVSLVAEYDGVQYVPLTGPQIFTGERPNTVSNANAVVEYSVEPEVGRIARDVSENSGDRDLSLRGPSVFRNFSGGVKVTYNGGFDTIPNDLKLATLDYIKLIYKKEQGTSSFTLQGETKQRFANTSTKFPPHVERILSFYRII